MSIVDSLMKKMKMNLDEDEDYDEDYDDYGEEEDPDEEIFSSKKVKNAKNRKKYEDDYDEDDYDLEEEEPRQSAYAPSGKKEVKAAAPQKSAKVVGMDGAAVGAKAPEVCMIVPKGFEDANTIADVLLSNRAVVLNLEGIDMAAAQRIIDFASGSCYTVGGNLQKISRKIFIVVPPDMNLSGDFDKLVGDMIDLNSVNMMK